MIEVKASSIVIHDYNLGDCPKLEKYLTIFDVLPNGHRLVKMQAFYYDEENNYLIIPRGYSIPRLESILEDNNVHYSNKYDPATRISLEPIGEPRDETQRDGIDFLLSRGKFSDLLYNTQKYVSLNTGLGKTFITVHAICELKRRSIIIVDSLQIAEQWKGMFLQFSNIKEKDIYLISGKSSIAKLYKDSKFEPSYKVYIALHQTFTSIFKSNPQGITEFFLKTKIGVKVYDEAHVSWSSIFNIDALTNTARNIYLSATPGRSNADENRLYQYCFEKVPMFGRDNIMTYRYAAEERDENDKYIKLYYIEYNSNPSYNTQLKMVRRDMFDMNAYYDYILNDIFNEFIEYIKRVIDICLKQDSDRRIVVILGKNDLIQKVYDDLINEYPKKSIGRFCGLVSPKNKEAEKDKDIVLSTEKSLGKAINVENIGYLINTIPFSSSVIAEQMIGRLRRNEKYSFLFDITDVGFSNCKNNQKYRGKTFDKIALSIRKIEL